MRTANKSPAGLYWDVQRRVCLLISRERGEAVRFIPMAVGVSFRVVKLTEPKFDAVYKAVPAQHPADLERHCFTYLRYCQDMGATAEVLDFLGAHTKVSKEQRAVALGKMLVEPVDAPKPVLRDKSKVKKKVKR